MSEKMQSSSGKARVRIGTPGMPPPADLPHSMSPDPSTWSADDHVRFDEHQRRKRLAGMGTVDAPTETEGDVQIIAGYRVKVIDPVTNRLEITDALGRKLIVQDLDPVEELDIYEACGTNSMNALYVFTAMMAASLRSITTPGQAPHVRAFPKNGQHIRSALQVLGRPGVTALRAVRNASSAPAGDDANDDSDASVNIAKN